MGLGLKGLIRAVMQHVMVTGSSLFTFCLQPIRPLSMWKFRGGVTYLKLHVPTGDTDNF